MIVIATVYEYDYKATVVYIRHMNIITSVWLLLPCPWPFNPNPVNLAMRLSLGSYRVVTMLSQPGNHLVKTLLPD